MAGLPALTSTVFGGWAGLAPDAAGSLGAPRAGLRRPGPGVGAVPRAAAGDPEGLPARLPAQHHAAEAAGLAVEFLAEAGGAAIAGAKGGGSAGGIAGNRRAGLPSSGRRRLPGPPSARGAIHDAGSPAPPPWSQSPPTRGRLRRTPTRFSPATGEGGAAAALECDGLAAALPPSALLGGSLLPPGSPGLLSRGWGEAAGFPPPPQPSPAGEGWGGGFARPRVVTAPAHANAGRHPATFCAFRGWRQAARRWAEAAQSEGKPSHSKTAALGLAG
jgi:hypothetical protein